MKDLAIDLNTTHDLDLVRNDLYLVSEREYLLQKISIVLQFFFGEWYLDTSVGLPLYQILFVKKPDVATIDAMIKKAILDIDGVTELSSYSSRYDSTTREFFVETEIKTIYGDITATETLI